MTGHGHVVPGPVKARCGGPALCADCTAELRALHRCGRCLDDGMVCEEHPTFPLGVALKGHSGRQCGIGMPCPACCSPVPQDGTRSITEAFTPDWLRGLGARPTRWRFPAAEPSSSLLHDGDQPASATASSAGHPRGSLA